MIRIAMKLLQLKYFLTICEYSNISRAAGKLHVSQPSLTAAMKSLEQEFGITLFHRQSRGLILTEEGEIILLFPALFNRSLRRTRMPGSRWLKMVL